MDNKEKFLFKYIAVGSFSMKTVTIKETTVQEIREKHYNNLNAEYKNILRLNSDGTKEILKGFENLDLNDLKDINFDILREIIISK